MPKSYKAVINPEVLKWARENALINVDEAAKKAGVSLDIYKKWEKGDASPTISKLRVLAGKFKRPLSVFYLDNIPESIPLPHDFRRPQDAIDYPLTNKSILAIRRARWLQSVAKELMDSLGKPIIPIKKHNIIGASIEKTIEDIRDLDMEIQYSWKDSFEALREWRQYLEDKGIFVFQIQMPKKEISGFSLIRDKYPPVIVINSEDYKNKRIFTLFHEYCHILLNESGVCIPHEETGYKEHRTENICDEFAGNFLVPTKHIKDSIDKAGSMSHTNLIENLAKKFSVSSFVILRRMYSLRKIDYSSYKNFLEKLREKIKEPGKGSGGDWYRTKITQVGRKYLSLVVEAESGRAITTSRALGYLEIQLPTYNKLKERVFA